MSNPIELAEELPWLSEAIDRLRGVAPEDLNEDFETDFIEEAVVAQIRGLDFVGAEAFIETTYEKIGNYCQSHDTPTLWFLRGLFHAYTFSTTELLASSRGNQASPPRAMCIGLGEDRHRLDEQGTGPLRLGGFDVAHDRGLIGHSDADVLLHAITDALLGAIGLPDIGEYFPNTDESNRGRDSAEFLRIAMGEVRAAGYELANLDCVLSAQSPKISPYKEVMRNSIAAILKVDASQIGLKAKTGEHVGPVGREEAIDARCVALVVGRGQ